MEKQDRKQNAENWKLTKEELDNLLNQLLYIYLIPDNKKSILQQFLILAPPYISRILFYSKVQELAPQQICNQMHLECTYHELTIQRNIILKIIAESLEDGIENLHIYIERAKELVRRSDQFNTLLEIGEYITEVPAIESTIHDFELSENDLLFPLYSILGISLELLKKLNTFLETKQDKFITLENIAQLEIQLTRAIDFEQIPLLRKTLNDILGLLEDNPGKEEELIKCLILAEHWHWKYEMSRKNMIAATTEYFQMNNENTTRLLAILSKVFGSKNLTLEDFNIFYLEERLHKYISKNQSLKIINFFKNYLNKYSTNLLKSRIYRMLVEIERIYIDNTITDTNVHLSAEIDLDNFDPDELEKTYRRERFIFGRNITDEQ